SLAIRRIASPNESGVPASPPLTRRDSSLRVMPASADTTPLIRMMIPAVAVSPNSCMERDDISAAA
ncbi:MAG: hypothetical protein WA970_17405, partial [Gammaproteobacteria bacterium]